MTLSFLTSLLSSLLPSVFSSALISSVIVIPYEKQQNKRNDPLVSRIVLQNAFRQNSKVYRGLFRISDNCDYRENHDYNSSEILSDNHEIAIIGLAKKVSIIAIIASNKKR
jgi:hypothetical protein